MTNLTIQPQRVALGSFKSPNGQEIQVYISQPWFRALNQLVNSIPAPSPAPAPIPNAATVATAPPFEFGDVVYSTTATELRRLRSTVLGDVLYNGGASAAPYWGPLPTPAPSAPPLLLYTQQGEVLLTEDGHELTVEA